jgi:hypothetical protein
MAATGFTPISLYFTTTAAAVPVNTNLVSGELALNITDEKLYFKNAGGTVKLLASNAIATFPSAGIANSTGTAWGTSYTTSGTGTVVVLATTPTITTPVLTNPTVSGYVESVAALGTVTGTATIVITAGTVVTATLTAATPCTFAMPTSPTAGNSFILRLTQAATGMTTATFTGVKWPGGTVPTITATASAVDIISFVYIGTAWYGNAAQAFA